MSHPSQISLQLRHLIDQHEQGAMSHAEYRRARRQLIVQWVPATPRRAEQATIEMLAMPREAGPPPQVGGGQDADALLARLSRPEQPVGATPQWRIARSFWTPAKRGFAVLLGVLCLMITVWVFFA